MQNLEEGEILCKKCSGVGELLPSSGHFGVERCKRCNGKGKLDWVQACMGTKKESPVAIPTQKAVCDYMNGKCAK